MHPLCSLVVIAAISINLYLLLSTLLILTAGSLMPCLSLISRPFITWSHMLTAILQSSCLTCGKG